MTDIDLSEFYPVRDTRCVIGKYIDQLTDEDQAKIKAALDRVDIALPAIVEFLLRRGFKTTTTTIGTHRKGLCRCG